MLRCSCCRWFLAIVLAIVAAITMTAQAQEGGRPSLSPQQEQWVASHRTIVVGLYDSDWPPFERVRGGKPEGLGYDYLNALARRLGMQVRTRVYSDWPEVLQAACRGEIDVVMNVVLTAQRTRCMVFTDAYVEAPVALVGRSRDTSLTSDSDLRGLNIVSERNFVTGELVRVRFPAAKHTEASNTASALDLIAKGQADVYIGNAYVAQQLLTEQGKTRLALVRPSDLPPESLHFGVPNAKQALAEAMDLALATISAQERRRLEARWLPPLRWASRSELTVSAAESRVLAQPLRTGFAPHWAPISFLDDEGHPSGLAAEYLRRLRAAGANLQLLKVQDWQEIRRKMHSGDLDVVVGVPSDTLMPGDDWVFSQPFLTVTNVIVTQEASDTVLNVADLNGQRIALSDPDRLGRHVLAQAPQARIMPTKSAEEGLQRLADGEVDAYIGNLAVVDHMLRQSYSGRLRIAAPAGAEDRLSLAVRRPYAPLATTFDRMLANMSDREREAIRGDWLAVEYRSAVDWRRIVRWAIPLALIVLSALTVHAWGHWRLRREVAVRRSVEKRLSEVTDNLPAVVYQAKRQPDGSVSFPFITGDMPALFGLPVEAAIQDERKVFARVHPEDQPRLVRAMERSAESLDSLDIEFRALSSNGWRWVRSRADAYPAEDGALLWSGYWVDVSQAHAQAEALASAKQTAEDAAAAKADFLAIMSHEIRTPMSGVLGMLEMLAHTRLDGEQRHVLKTIEDSAQMLRQILDDILDFSKIEAGALLLEAEPVNLRQVVDNVQQMLSAQATDKNLRVHNRIDAGVAQWHRTDGVRLRQILFNLLSNAIKFTEQGEISIWLVRLEQADGAQRLRLSVLDTGIGMTPEQQARLFRPFAQAESSTNRRYGGTGLGLSICRRLVDLMGGELSMQSVAGQGTRVDVELILPVIAAADAPVNEDAAQAPPETSPVADWAGRRVLIVEDHPTNQALMAWRMQQLGLRCRITADGSAALEALDEERFDVVITDCRMPVMDGYTLARAIRKRESERGHARLPIIALTASALQEEADRCREAGMDDFLAKPAPLAVLRACLARWLPSTKRDTQSDADMASMGAMPAATPPALDREVLDRAALSQRFGSEEMVQRLLDSLAATTHEDLDALKSAVHADDALRAEECLHRIAGGVGTVGAESLAMQARELMTYIERDGLAPHATAATAFGRQVAMFVQAFKAG
jgi:two-component system, NarL family, sensor histidine kinase EvgS